MTARDVAWAEVFAVLPTGWMVTPPVFDPESHLWRVCARDLRGALASTSRAGVVVGADEATAVQVLAARFRLTSGDETA